MSLLFCIFFFIVYASLKSRDKRYKKKEKSRSEKHMAEHRRLEAIIDADRQYFTLEKYREVEPELTEPMFKSSWFLVTQAVYSLRGKIYQSGFISGDTVVPNTERPVMQKKLLWINENLRRHGVEGYVYLYSATHKYVYPESPMFNPYLRGGIIWAPLARLWHKEQKE